MIAQIADAAVQIGAVQLVYERRRDADGNFGEGFRERPVHLVGNAVGSLVGHLGRNGTLLLVRVIRDLRVFHVVGIE